MGRDRRHRARDGRERETSDERLDERFDERFDGDAPRGFEGSFREAERAEGDAGTVSYSFMGDMESEPEPEPEPEPEQKFGYGFGGVYGGAGMKNITPFQRNRMMAPQKAFNKTTGGDLNFQTWLASKYGNNN